MSKVNLVLMMLSVFVASSASADIISTCKHGDKTRVISVVYLEPGSKVPCEVQYQKSQTTKVLWSATNSGGYCEKKAAQFVEKQINWGWQCEQLDTDSQATQTVMPIEAQSQNTEKLVKTESKSKQVQKVPVQELQQKTSHSTNTKQKIKTKVEAKKKLKTQSKQTVAMLDEQVLMQAIDSVDIIKEMVEEYYNTYGEYPSNFDQLGVQQSDMQSKHIMKNVMVLTQGHVAITDIKNMRNKTILKPRPVLGELIHDWSCQTNIKLSDEGLCQFNSAL
jgi:hypothetical protein